MDNQAVDRSFRIGQTRNVVVYRSEFLGGLHCLLSDGSVAWSLCVACAVCGEDVDCGCGCLALNSHRMLVPPHTGSESLYAICTVLCCRFITCGTVEEVIYRKQVFKAMLFKTATKNASQTR